jgi:hypothetical protein
MASKARRILHGLVFDSSIFVFALFVGICGGIVGVLVDIDHLPMVWGGEGSRALHTPLAIFAGIVALYCLARLGGLLYKVVSLKNKRR